MRYIIYWLAAVGLGVIVMWIYHSIKAVKDPDVQAASDLRMSVTRYRLYKELFDKHQEAIQNYGSFSKEANELFVKEINPRIPNPNEWRRFCEYQTKLEREKMYKELGY